MAKFLGFKQVTKAEFDNISRADKLNYMWLVRDLDESGNTKSASIYFGSREYGNLGNVISGDIITAQNLSDYVPELIKDGDTFVLDYESIAANLDYTQISGMTELADKVDVVYNDMYPSGSTENSLVKRVADLEDVTDTGLSIDNSDDDEPLSE